MPGRSQISSADNRYKFTGKERGTETNYDYFGARYYDSRIGRWLQVDPLADKYPGWSPYNYTLNNPIKFIDPNGKWSEKTHNNFISKAFSFMSTKVQGILMEASAYADIDQDPKNSFKHAMRYSDQTIDEAEDQYNKFLDNQINKFVDAETTEDAYFQLGLGLHAIMDNTAPSHKGFQLWRGIEGNNSGETAVLLGYALSHYVNELLFVPTKEQEKITVEAMLEYLKKAEKRYKEEQEDESND